MFIYKFMSGLVDTIKGDEELDTYDPHVHRKIEKPTSYADTMIHLLKGSIGAGILAMPDAMSRVGVVGGLVGMVVVGILATYCIHLLISAQYELCKRNKVGYMSYAKSMRIALESGPSCFRRFARLTACFVDTVLVIWQLGLCCVYIVFVASNIKQVMDFYGHNFTLRQHIVIQFIPLAMVNMIKDLKLLTPLSTLSNIVTIFGLILVFYYMIEDDLHVDETKLFSISLAGVPVFIGMTLFALEAVGVVLALEYNMEKPKQFGGMCGLFNMGMTIIISLYIITGVFGYLKYGKNIAASVTLNLPENQKKAQVAKMIFAIAIFLTFPLQNFVAYKILLVRTMKRTPPSSHRAVDITHRILCIVIPWVCAICVPQLGPFISLFGALCLSLLGFVFPALLDMCTWHSKGYGICAYKFVRDFIIIILGVTCLISGCYTSILEIQEGF